MKQAINEAMRAVAEVNKYVSDSEPWKIKDDPARGSARSCTSSRSA